ncbi:Solute carrier family 2, facilitated glucose transporter member 5, partial [Ophiophagus hannah]
MQKVDLLPIQARNWKETDLPAHSLISGVQFGGFPVWIHVLSCHASRCVLKELRGEEDVEEEMEELRQEQLAESSQNNMTVWKLLRFRSLRWHVITVMVLVSGSQFVETNSCLLLLNNTLAFFASVFLCISNSVHLFKFTLFANFIIGISSEVSPTPIRGFMTATSAFFFSLGVLLGHTLGLPQILGNKEGAELYNGFPKPGFNYYLFNWTYARTRAFPAVNPCHSFHRWILRPVVHSFCLWHDPDPAGVTPGPLLSAGLLALLCGHLHLSFQDAPRNQGQNLCGDPIGRKRKQVKPKTALNRFQRNDGWFINSGLRDASWRPFRMLTRPLVLITLISAFGSSVQYGYNAFVIFYPAKYIQNFYNETYRFRNVISIDHSLLKFQWGLTVAFFPFGGFCGTLIAGPLVDSIGRRAHELLICSRFFVGICAGIAFSVVPMYLAEIAPQNLRGALCTVADLFITFGSLLAEAIGFREVLGTEESWPVLLSLTGIPALLQLLFLPFFPESPRFLLIQKKEEEEARQALKTLRCSEDVEQEMEQLQQEELADRKEKDMDVMKILYYPGLRWHVVSIVVLMAGQQLSGINAAHHYAKQIYLSSGVSDTIVWYISMALSLFLMVITTLVICIVESSGRRILLLTGFGICIIAGIFLPLSAIEACYLLHPDPVPSVLVAEYFLQTCRSTAFVVAGSIHWICKFLIIVTYLHMEIELEPYSFLFFWPFNIATILYIAKMIPETKGRSFLEIRRIFSCAVPLYLAEIAPRNLRGGIITMAMIAIGVGVLFSQILGLHEFLGSKRKWAILLSLTGILAVFQLLILPNFPESPLLRVLRDKEDVEEEIEELHQEDVAEMEEKELSVFSRLTYKGLRKQIISVILLMAGQQFSGVNAVYYYAETIYRTKWLNEYKARYISITYSVDSLGRRLLILVGFGTCSTFCVLLTISQELQMTVPWLSYVTYIFLLMLLIGHMIGPGPIPNIIIAELFLQSSRSTGIVLGCFVHWFLKIITGIMVFEVEIKVGSYSFLLFWPLCIAGFVFIFRNIPETKHKSFLQIRNLLAAQAIERINVRGSQRRKGTMMTDNYISLVCSMLMIYANLQHGFIFAMVFRFFIGISMVIGVQLAQIFAFPELLGTVEGWPVLVSLPGLLAIWQILLLPSCPESPRYLLMQKKEEEEAREVLKHLRLQSDVEDELEELRREDLFEKDEKKMNTLRLLGYRPLRWNLIYLYVEEMLYSTGLSHENARYFQMMTTGLLILAIVFG